MPYGTVKVDNITFDQGGADQNVTTSGIYRAITSGVTVTGTISGAVLVGTTTVSGATVTGTTVQGTTVQGVSGAFTSLTGTTTTGTTANFVSGVFTTRVSGATITGTTAQFTSGTFVSLTGTTITGTTISGTTVSSTTGTFTSLTGTTITGTTVNGTTVNSITGNFTSLTGVTVTGTTANFVSGVFTTQVSGLTVTGTQSSFTSGNFVTLSGATATFTSGVIASGTAAAPSLSILGDPNTGIYSPGADQVAISTNGTGRLFISADGAVGIRSSSPFTNAASLDVIHAIGQSPLPTARIFRNTSGSAGDAIEETALDVSFANARNNTTVANGLKVYAEAGLEATNTYALYASVNPRNNGIHRAARFVGGHGNVAGVGVQYVADFIATIGGTGTSGNVRGIYIETPDYNGADLRNTAIVHNNLNTNTATQDTIAFQRNGTVLGRFFTTGTDFGIRANATLQFLTGSTERARIDSSGRLGLGTSSPDQRLVISGGLAATGAGTFDAGNTAGAYFSYESGGDARVFARSVGTASYLSFWTSTTGGSSEKVRITDAGSVGIGTTSPSSKCDISSNTNNVLTDVNSASNYHLYLKNPDNANGEAVGLCFGLSNGNDIGASIYHLRSGANSFGSLIFATKPNGGSNQERARIDSSGRLLVGTSTAQSGTRSQYSKFTVQGNNQSTSDGAQVNLAINTNAASLNTGDTLGQIIFTDNGPGEYGRIACQMDGAGAGSGDYPGRLVFSTTADGAASPTERMRIDSSGRLLVGTTATTGFQPGARHILLDGQTTYGSISVGNIGGAGTLTDLNLTAWAGSGSNYFTSKIRQVGDGALTFYTQSTVSTDGAGTTTERMRLDASTGNLLIGKTSTQANGGVLQVSNGITFPATAVACTDVNTLDDYEEGTWTPSLGGTATYTTQVGRYTKIGNLVSISFQLVVNTIGTGSTSTVSGLPFGTNGTERPAGSVSYWSSLATNVLFLGCYSPVSSSNVAFTSATTSGATANIDVAIFGNSARVEGSMVYRV